MGRRRGSRPGGAPGRASRTRGAPPSRGRPRRPRSPRRWRARLVGSRADLGSPWPTQRYVTCIARGQLARRARSSACRSTGPRTTTSAGCSSSTTPDRSRRVPGSAASSRTPSARCSALRREEQGRARRSRGRRRGSWRPILPSTRIIPGRSSAELHLAARRHVVAVAIEERARRRARERPTHARERRVAGGVGEHAGGGGRVGKPVDE